MQGDSDRRRLTSHLGQTTFAGLYNLNLPLEIQPLSPREKTVLHLLAWGHTNKEVANLLSISVKTVEAHKANGMRKLRLLSRAALVRHAVQHGWLALDAVPRLFSDLGASRMSGKQSPTLDGRDNG